MLQIGHGLAKQPGKDVAKEDERKPVRISEFPPVSVNRDWSDGLMIFFTGILMIVGVLGVRAANKTPRTIQRQTKATENSVKSCYKCGAAVAHL